MRAGLLLVVVVAAVAAFAARTLVVAVARRRWPGVAAAADRWWPWVPLAVVCLLVIWWNPLVGLLATVSLVVALTRLDVPGWPLRPRR